MLRLQELKKDANLFRLAISVRNENVTAEPVASLFLLSRHFTRSRSPARSWIGVILA